MVIRQRVLNYRYAPNVELLVYTAGRNKQYELICPDSLIPASDSQKQDDILAYFHIHFADMLLPGTKKEEINEKEEEKGQYQNNADLSLLNAIDIEELCMKLTSFNDDEIVNESGKPKVTIITQNNSTSWIRKDTFSTLEKEGGKGKNQNNGDLSFLDVLHIEELCMKLPSIDDIETVKAASKPKVKIISRRKHKVEPSLRIRLLKKLASKARYLYALS
ncbi:hypothetical protein CHS0354_012998 [Potamilus streckersoni]|uniref:Uncharacterized protein n=1 Tax=Potamilus streckersoni TaxID=2493646 RepID=A0AAE0W7P8_9BIVA|nr:hypothetical protein CHS0354_012998 [Potamilus streckersoni]